MNKSIGVSFDPNFRVGDLVPWHHFERILKRAFLDFSSVVCSLSFQTFVHNEKRYSDVIPKEVWWTLIRFFSSSAESILLFKTFHAWLLKDY